MNISFISLKIAHFERRAFHLFKRENGGNVLLAVPKLKKTFLCSARTTSRNVCVHCSVYIFSCMCVWIGPEKVIQGRGSSLVSVCSM